MPDASGFDTSGSFDVVFVADRPLLSELLAAVLFDVGRRTAVVCDPPTEHALARVGAAVPPVAFLDIELRRGVPCALKLVERLHARGTRVAVIAADRALTLRAACARAGVDAIVSPNNELDAVIDLVERLLRDEQIMSPEERCALLHAENTRRRDDVTPFDRLLTSKEKLAVMALLRGASVRHIADGSGVSVATIRGRVQSVMAKIEVGSQIELVAAAHSAGWPHVRSPED